VSRGKALHDTGKKAAKEHFKRWIEPHVKDPAAVNFMLEQFDAAYDLVLASVENGGVPTKGDVIRYFGGKAVGFASLSQENRVACVASIVQLGLTASTAPAKGVAGPAGWAWYIGAILLDGLDVGGNCYLAYQDAMLERQLAEFEKQITARRMVGHSQAKISIDSGRRLDPALEAMLDWRSRQPNEPGGICVAPSRALVR